MEKHLTALMVALFVAAFTLGIVLTNVMTPVPEPVVNTEIKEVPVIQTEYVDVPGETITVEVPGADMFLDEAIDALFDELGDDESFLTCRGHEFDEDEVTINRVKKWTYTWLDDEEHGVSFDAKFEFQDDSDDRDCKETRGYTVVFEEGEDPIVS